MVRKSELSGIVDGAAIVKNNFLIKLNIELSYDQQFHFLTIPKRDEARAQMFTAALVIMVKTTNNSMSINC